MNVTGLSPSSIDCWEQCPRKWYEEKINSRSGGTGEPALMGSFVHLILEHLMQLPASQRSTATARSIAASAWTEFSTSDEWSQWVTETGFADETGFKRRAWASVCGYFQIENPATITVLSTEQFLQTEVGGVPVRGIVDRLDRNRSGLVVADYKTGKVPSPWFRKTKDRQINLYAAMIEAVQGTRPVLGRLIFTTHAEAVDVRINDRSINEAVTSAATAWADIHTAADTGVWEEKGGPLCGWCPFVAECATGLAEIRDRYSKGKLKPTAPAWELAVGDTP